MLRAGSRIGWPALARTAFLAVVAAALVFLPDTKPSTEAWLGIGLAVALVGLAALSVGLLALPGSSGSFASRSRRRPRSRWTTRGRRSAGASP